MTTDRLFPRRVKFIDKTSLGSKTNWTRAFSPLRLKVVFYGRRNPLNDMSAVDFAPALTSFKVAEHSFSARFCWCKLARAQGFQKTNIPSTERSFYLLTPALSVLFFSITACSVLMALVFYYNDMLQKVTMQRTQHFSFCLLPKEPS